MMPDYMEALVSQVGVQRILTDLLDVVIDSYVDEERKKGKNHASYLYVLKNDLEVALMRYKQRYILEDAKEEIDDDVA